MLMVSSVVVFNCFLPALQKLAKPKKFLTVQVFLTVQELVAPFVTKRSKTKLKSKFNL